VGRCRIEARYEILSKLRMEWIDWFEKSRDDPSVKAPTGDYVLKLRKAAREGREFNAQADVRATADILNLNEFRGDLEHVKPRTWCLEVGGLPRMGANVARAFAALRPSFSYQLEPEEIAQVFSFSVPATRCDRIRGAGSCFR
jgi:hypothetical protein